MKRRLREGESLIEGLNHHERIARLERAVRGPGGLSDGVARLEYRLQELESTVRRMQMPWWLRWLTGLGLKRETR